MQRDILLKTIKDYENKFKIFIGTDEFPTFSMDTIVETFAGEKSVSQYVGMKQQHAIDLSIKTYINIIFPLIKKFRLA